MTLPEPVREALDTINAKACAIFDIAEVGQVVDATDTLRDHITTLTAERDDLTQRCAAAERRYAWAANELLACDYGDNLRGEIGWLVYGWRGRGHGRVRIYGATIDAAIDAAIHQETRHG